MAAAPWPVGVPQNARFGSWQLIRPFRQPHRTQFEDGVQRGRRSSSKNIATISFSIVPMTLEQFETFLEWVRDDLVDGTLPDGFLMNVFNGRAYAERICHMNADPPYRSEFDSGFQVVTFAELDVEDL